MAAETAKQFEALERQAQTLMSAFMAAGYEAVAPAVIQPANVFLDVVGEALRARTYVFSDPDGNELCLRPDLTVPTCRLFLERGAKEGTTAKYCYNGAAFRFQPANATASHPREFRQSGIENFGNVAHDSADAETVALIVSAVTTAGLTDATLRLGDLGLYRAILEAIGLPEGQRRRLSRAFRRPGTFRREIQRLTLAQRAVADWLPAKLQRLIIANPSNAEKTVAHYLDEQKIDAVGTRSLAEVAGTLAGRLLEADAPPVRPQLANLLTAFTDISVPLARAAKTLGDLTRSASVDISPALDLFQSRVRLMEKAGLDLSRAQFSSTIGRSFEYYTGFVFDLVLPSLGPDSPVAAGGRYDGLMKAIGATTSIPAVGAAIHTERLLAAVNGGQS